MNRIRTWDVDLEQWGARVVSAQDSKRAMELAKDEDSRLDLVIADFRVSCLETGIGILRGIAHSLDRELPRILISSDMSSRLQDEARNLGVPLLHKPVQPAKLRALIHHVMH